MKKENKYRSSLEKEKEKKKINISNEKKNCKKIEEEGESSIFTKILQKFGGLLLMQLSVTLLNKIKEVDKDVQNYSCS